MRARPRHPCAALAAMLWAGFLMLAADPPGGTPHSRDSTLAAVSARCAPSVPSGATSPPRAGSSSGPAVTLRWLGHACFLITSPKGLRILMDPYGPQVGYPVVPVPCDVVTISHEHVDHNNAAMATGRPRVLRGLARGGAAWAVIHETVGDVVITTIPAYHDDRKGALRGLDAIFVLDVGGLRVAHFGDVGAPLTPAQIKALGRVDVALVPVGGVYTIDGAGAAALVRALRPPPTVVIPMHYKTARTSPDLPLAGVQPFLDQCPTACQIPSSQMTVHADAGGAPRTTTVIVLSL